MRGEPTHIGDGARVIELATEARDQVAAGDRETMRRRTAVEVPVAKSQGVLQDLFHCGDPARARDRPVATDNV